MSLRSKRRYHYATRIHARRSVGERIQSIHRDHPSHRPMFLSRFLQHADSDFLCLHIPNQARMVPLGDLDRGNQTLHRPCALSSTAPWPPNHRELNTSAAQKQQLNSPRSSPSWLGRLAGTTQRDAPKLISLCLHPSGKLPPVISSAAGGSRTASAILVRLITGHAFVDSYTAHFHPRNATHCHCPACRYTQVVYKLDLKLK